MHPKKPVITRWSRLASVGRSIRYFFSGLWARLKTAYVKSTEALKTQYKKANAKVSSAIGSIHQALVDMKEQLRKRFVHTQPTAEHN